MRQLTTAVAVAAIGMLVAACGDNKDSGPASSSTTTTTSSRPPVAQAALAGFLLTPAEIDGALGVTGTSSKEKTDKLVDDNAKQQWPQGWKFPAECFYALNPAEASVYDGSGNTAVSGDDDVASLPPGSNDPDPEVTQAVVLFPSPKEASAFFITSSQRWPACADHQFTTPGDADNPQMDWKVGAPSTANAILSTTLNVTLTKGDKTMKVACQRALTQRNNVVIDVSVCRTDAGDLGVKVANQIGDKVDKQ
jgi:hypothetical protein